MIAATMFHQKLSSDVENEKGCVPIGSLAPMPAIVGNFRDNILWGTRQIDDFDGRGGSDVYLVGMNSNFNFYSDSGTFGWDVIVATAPNMSIKIAETFNASNGIEEISGGGFEDVYIQGSPRDDVFIFQDIELTGIDRIEAAGGNDVVIGGDGSEDLRGNNGHDKLVGGLGNDTLFSGGKNDTIPGEDLLHLDDGNDTLVGGAGEDFMSGGADQDSLEGGPDDDILHGGRGSDTITGGNGADTFLYIRAYEAQNDVITDFVSGEDVFDLSDVDGDSQTSGFQSLVFIGEAPSVVRNALTYEVVGNHTFVRADTAGDGIADFEITLLGAIDLQAGDFIL